MFILFSFITIFIVIVAGYLQLPLFGKSPTGKALERIQKSPNYRNGKFQNKTFTPSITEGYTIPGVLYEFLFKQNPDRTPPMAIPSIKTDLKNIPFDKDVLVWFGHSSYFIQLDGKRFLIDPVFSGNASPLPRSNSSFKGTDLYSVDDLPAIDYLLITHDHYDHLDYKTFLAIKSKANKVICGLGVASHLIKWGYPAEKITEMDWDESAVLEAGFTIHSATTRHFSGRGFTRNNTLWLSFILESPTIKIYIGGDSGYDKHFAEIGEKFGPFDLVILDCGQYDIKWKYIHMLPNEVLQAAKDLKAKKLLPVHSSKFALSNHAWNEPLSKITALNEAEHIPMITPMIGEPVNLKAEGQIFKKWWEEIVVPFKSKS